MGMLEESATVNGTAMPLERVRRSLAAWKGKCAPADVLCAALCVVYAFLFVKGIAPYWFNPLWTTDDALQQAFPFYNVYHPEVFAGDLVAQTMQGYLAPLHLWLGYGITWFVKDPIMTCHWIMLIQVALTVWFLFLAVRKAAGFAPACLAVAWLLHTRPVMQRITGGLPRGWSAPVLAAFLWLAFAGRHKAMLAAILCACLLHPPGAVLIGAAYGLTLVVRLIPRASRRVASRRLISLLLFGPVYALVLLMVVHRPAELGQMVDYDTAAAMPEFQYPHGRFPFLPFEPVLDELKMYGFQPFFHRLHRPGVSWPVEFKPVWWKGVMTWFLPILLILVSLAGFRRQRRNVVPLDLVCFAAAIFAVYAASRQFAFKLYVPNRHLQFPLTMFWIAAFTIVPWRAFSIRPELDVKKRGGLLPLAALGCVALMVIVGTGAGFDGSANFNFPVGKRGAAFVWLRKNTPERALVAGHPVHIDPVQLFAMRRGYATIETTHPFYLGYYGEMKRRLIISYKAHYAQSLQEVVDLLAPEGIDYFVFARKRFYPGAMKAEKVYSPIDEIVKPLLTRAPDAYAYRQLPTRVNLETAPYMPFRDEQSAVIDVALLRKYLSRGGS